MNVDGAVAIAYYALVGMGISTGCANSTTDYNIPILIGLLFYYRPPRRSIAYFICRFNTCDVI